MGPENGKYKARFDDHASRTKKPRNKRGSRTKNPALGRAFELGVELVKNPANGSSFKIGLHALEEHHDVRATQRLVELIAKFGSLHGAEDGGITTTRNGRSRSDTSELQSRPHLVCRLLLEKKKKTTTA